MLHNIIVCTFTLSSQFQHGCHIISYTFALSFYIRLCYNFVHCSVIILNTDVLCFVHSYAWFVYCRLIVLYTHVVWFCTLLFDHFVNCCLDTLFTLLDHHFGYHCFVHCWIIILCAVMLSYYCTPMAQSQCGSARYPHLKWETGWRYGWIVLPDLAKWYVFDIIMKENMKLIDLSIDFIHDKYVETIKKKTTLQNNNGIRAGQDQGGPRWDILTKKSESTKLLHIVLCYTQGVAAYDPVLLGRCIPLTLTFLKVKPKTQILISIGGWTLQFLFLYYQNLLL